VNYSYSVHNRETKKKAVEVQAVGLCCDREGRDRDSEMHRRFAKSDRGRGKEVRFVKIFTNFARLCRKSMFANKTKEKSESLDWEKGDEEKLVGTLDESW
jgi:hypothetical protein